MTGQRGMLGVLLAIGLIIAIWVLFRQLGVG